MAQRQEVHPEFCDPTEPASPVACCHIRREALYWKAAASENVMFGLATNRCCRTAGEEHPADASANAAIPKAKPRPANFVCIISLCRAATPFLTKKALPFGVEDLLRSSGSPPTKRARQNSQKNFISSAGENPPARVLQSYSSHRPYPNYFAAQNRNPEIPYKPHKSCQL
jgi:hypothetical protein